MAKKTVIRQLFKTLPTSIEIHRSQVHDESTVKLNDDGELDVEETALDRFAERQARSAEQVEDDAPAGELGNDTPDEGGAGGRDQYADDEIPFEPGEETTGNELPVDYAHYGGWKDQNKRLGQLLRHVDDLSDQQIADVRPVMARLQGVEKLEHVHPDAFRQLVDDLADASASSGDNGEISARAELILDWMDAAESGAQGELVN
jgi:hypothetical protein